MTHQIDPDARYIAAGIARAECYANTFDRLRADLEADLATAARRRYIAILEEAAATRRRSRRLAAWVIASAALGSASVYAIVLGAITAAGLA